MFKEIKTKLVSLEETNKTFLEEIKNLKKEIETINKQSQNLETALKEAEKEIANLRLCIDGDQKFYIVISTTIANHGRGAYGSVTKTETDININTVPMSEKRHWDDGFWSVYDQTTVSYPIEPVGYQNGEYIFIYKNKKYTYKIK
jgi:seryl-tRNA synthetase